MHYDIVIPTADRSDILEVSIPTMLKQARPPHQLIIVDASDNSVSVQHTVEAATRGSGVQTVVLHADRSASAQRNLGLERVESDVVFFPDDDSLWHPGVAEEVMAIYERDDVGQIGGVGQAMAQAPPHKLSDEEQAARKAGPLDRVKYQLASWRFSIMAKLLAPPLDACGEELMRGKQAPPWLAEHNAHLAQYQIGFRMSYRTEVARRYRFNEALYPPRCGLEDFDLSFMTWRSHLVVEAERALVYHHKIGGKRGSPAFIGITQVLNLAYVIARHAPEGSNARRRVRPMLSYMLFENRMRRTLSDYDRVKYQAMKLAWTKIDEIFAASTDESITSVYRRCFEQCLEAFEDLMGEPVTNP